MPIRTPTLYPLLMVDPGVDDDVLTVVYRRLVQRANLAYEDEGQRRERLSVIEQAYAVLHDADRRRRYDLRVAGIPAQEDAKPITAPAAVVAIETPREVVSVTPAPKSVPVVSSGGAARILDFGRYAGWSLRQVALRDPDYLEWLRRSPGGRHLQSDISVVLTPR